MFWNDNTEYLEIKNIFVLLSFELFIFLCIREQNLGGVAFVDLSLDDFAGICSEEKFPLLNAVWSTDIEWLIEK